MAKKKDDDGEMNFPKKYEKFLPTGWKDTAESMSEEELKKTIVESENTIADVEKDMDSDDRLRGLKEEVKDIAGGYKDLIKTHEAKVRYSVLLLRQQGKI